MENTKVWVPDTAEGFILGRITDINCNDDVTVEPIDKRRQPIVCTLDRVYPAIDENEKDVDDNCSLLNLNEATLLHNLRLRYAKDKIYTYVANILIAVNPYIDFPDLYSSRTIKKYQGKSLGVMAPHVFAIADKAFRDMKVLKKSQSIIVSGESGAGKTESTKYILRYLCDLWGTHAGPIEQKILDANPVLEAFGNAKTTRNNNSSRFGKFIEVHFDSKCQVVGGFISHYLLEKSRICTQGVEERDYHVFYHICAGAPESLRQQLHITKPDDFHYLRRGCTQYFTSPQSENQLSGNQKSKAQVERGSLHDPLLDDVKDFKLLDEALSRIGLSEKERLAIYTIVAAVLHLGNVTFEDNPEDAKGGSRVCTSAEKSLSIAANLMGVDTEELRQALVSKVMQTSRGGLKGTVIMVPLKVYEANHARDALAKALFNKLFDYIVQRINQSIPFKASSYYIGVLDIAGFEYFTVNSFEQFCINYCNEKLQQFFNERILKNEQTLYEKEGLAVQKIEFVDNQDCIDLIESKGLGIFSLLDEESKLPKHSAAHFTEEVHSRFSGHFRLAYPRMSKLRDHREIRDDEGFLFRHFAGAVCYQTSQFIEKNNDALHASLEGLIQESRNPFLKCLFTSLNISQQKGKLNFISVGSKFKTQLGELMHKLKSTGTNFVRCIKPNLKMEHHHFDGGSILSQLQCSGMTKVLELMQKGYPSRAPFKELYELYRHSMPQRLAQLEPRLFCKALFRALGLNERDFCFGVEKVFFRAGKFAEFDQIMKSDPESLLSMIAKVQKWLLSARWKRIQWGTLSVIKLKNKICYRRECYIMIQKNCRMFLAQKQHQPRYKGIMKINSLQSMLTKMEGIIKQLKKDRERSEAEVKTLKADMTRAIQEIKSNPKISPKKINDLHTELMNKSNNQMSLLQKKVEQQRNAEEQEKMRKLKEQMEKERLRKEEEERRRREEEETKRMKMEMETRRKAEEEMKRRLEEEDRKSAVLMEAQMQKDAADEAHFREQQEQERRDYELSYRLSQETNSQMDEMSLQSRSRLAVVELKNFPPKLNRPEKSNAAQVNKKYDMSKYKYSELRDIINTSCEIELLEACRIEFHRRLKVYHAWKAKNKRRTTMEEKERAPRSVMEAAKTKVPRTPVKNPVAVSTDRYFRIPFIRPAVKSIDSGTESTSPISVSSGTRGWWYAHFHGQYVARQMELHPNKPAILLIAGIDDMQMCELSLDETGLTRKRGAEILEQEFNREWESHGGKPFVPPNSRVK